MNPPEVHAKKAMKMMFKVFKAVVALSVNDVISQSFRRIADVDEFSTALKI